MGAFLKGFVYAGRGLKAGLHRQRNIKVMLGCAALAVALGLIVGLSRLEWAVIALCCGLVLSLELTNTALERLIDRVCPDRDPAFGQVKDILAGAVLVASVAAAAAGLLIYVRPLVALLGR